MKCIMSELKCPANTSLVTFEEHGGLESPRQLREYLVDTKHVYGTTTIIAL